MKVTDAAPDMRQRAMIQTTGIFSSTNTDWSESVWTTVDHRRSRTNRHKNNIHHITRMVCIVQKKRKILETG